MGAIRVRVSETGRLSLPIELRKTLGIERGGTLFVELKDDELRMWTVDIAVKRAQALFRQHLGDYSGSLVDDLIAERRREGAKEEKEFKCMQQSSTRRRSSRS